MSSRAKQVPKTLVTPPTPARLAGQVKKGVTPSRGWATFRFKTPTTPLREVKNLLGDFSEQTGAFFG